MNRPKISCLLILFCSLLVTIHLNGQEEEVPAADVLPSLDQESTNPEEEGQESAPFPGENIIEDSEQPEQEAAEEENQEEKETPPPSETPAPKESPSGISEEKNDRTYGKDRDSDTIFYYTYLGPSISAGFNSISFSGWNEGAHREFTDGGWFTQPGGSCFVHVNPLIAQIDLGFRLNFNDTETTSCHHTRISAKGKYMHPTFPKILLGGGGGLYFESAPATKSYDGTGILACASAAYKLSSSWMMLFDCDFGFGTFGIGEGSTKIEYGITIGAGKKMGNL